MSTPADEEKRQRLIGSMQAAAAVLKQCSADIDLEQRRGRDLLDVAQSALNKAILAVWEKSS